MIFVQGTSVFAPSGKAAHLLLEAALTAVPPAGAAGCCRAGSIKTIGRLLILCEDVA